MPTSDTRVATPIVVGLGELLWDVFPRQQRPGGAPANVAFIAQQLGVRGAVLSRIGQDPLGDELLAFLQSHGLTTEYVQRDARHPTSTVTVDLALPDHPQYTIHPEVAWDYLAFDAATERLIGQASAICFGTLAQRHSVARATIQHCLQVAPPDCLRVYDVNLRPPWFERAWIESSLKAAQIVKLNGDEVGQLAVLLELTERDVPAVVDVLRRKYALEWICVTRGADGCLLFDAEGVSDLPGIPIQVADPVGAGDAFTAALIYARLHNWPRAAAAQLANHVAALVASRPGAMPEIRAEASSLLRT